MKKGLLFLLIGTVLIFASVAIKTLSNYATVPICFIGIGFVIGGIIKLTRG